ncbi:myelin-oligodendrocyte glycoprotein-like [Alligator sinensis]|uniref:Myelin-oligodendrocyte glycoprotein-like n=1 Tax=Alligator sinensis TaxID=38654 RepID=A0A3Q0FVL5_ALLSI|nr:myelin-oligodendrocyte glycoprotein-like [Alligator sinensis]
MGSDSVLLQGSYSSSCSFYFCIWLTMKKKASSFQCFSVTMSLPGAIVLFMSFHVFKPTSAQFKVIGPDQPVTAIVGQETVLPCHLSLNTCAENMEVRWFQHEPQTFVHLYHNGKDQYRQQMPEYHGRTELLKDGLMDGHVSLKFVNTRPSDEGPYHCSVTDGISYAEAILELRVADPFFPKVNPWMVALCVMLVVLFGFILLTVYLFKVAEMG